MGVQYGKGATANIVESIQETAKLYREDAQSARETLLDLSYQLSANLELPSETVSRIGWAEPARYAACVMAVDLGLFQILSANEDKIWKTSDLAKRTEAEPDFLARFLKHLAAMNIIDESSTGGFCATPLSKALAEPALGNGIKFLHEVLGPSFAGMPSYFASNGYENSLDPSVGPFQYAHKTELPFFDWMKERPSTFQSFNQYMTGYRLGKKSFLESYPFEQRIISGFDTNEQTLLVDIGGGMGQDLLDVRTRFSILPGDLILQDLPQVISQIPEARSSGTFKSSVHDFFTPQPVKGARAYYLHSILHDWDDNDCRKILQKVIDAMKRGYSKLLVNEVVALDVGSSWEVTSLDLAMLSVNNARERTEAEWRRMLTEVGLKVTDVVQGNRECIIEAELA